MGQNICARQTSCRSSERVCVFRKWSMASARSARLKH